MSSRPASIFGEVEDVVDDDQQRLGGPVHIADIAAVRRVQVALQRQP
jgi:hypothetical protein